MNRLKVGTYKEKPAFVMLYGVVGGGLQLDVDRHSVSIYTHDPDHIWGLKEVETRDFFGLDQHQDEIDSMFDRVEGHEVEDAGYACPAARAYELGWIPDHTGG